MFTYWAFFTIVALVASLRQSHEQPPNRWLWASVMVLVALLIGLRFEVGGDWFAYTALFRRVGDRHFVDAISLRFSEPGYLALNWLARAIGAQIWLVNLFCGVIFAWGLSRLCRTQPQPWLVLLVAIPYMIIVVALGYSRQGVALGILMAGLAAVLNGAGVLRFAAYVAVAALFHKTAIVLFPIVALAMPRGRLLNLLVAVSFTLILFNVFLQDDAEALVKGYVVARYNSQGALVRVLMSASAAALFFIFQRRFAFAEGERLLWRNMSLTSFGMLILLAVSPSSTAIDRIALYLLPLQCVIWARLPGTVMTLRTGQLAVLSFAFSVQYVWLNYAQFSSYWLPYRIYPVLEAGEPARTRR